MARRPALLPWSSPKGRPQPSAVLGRARALRIMRAASRGLWAGCQQQHRGGQLQPVSGCSFARWAGSVQRPVSGIQRPAASGQWPSRRSPTRRRGDDGARGVIFGRPWRPVEPRRARGQSRRGVLSPRPRCVGPAALSRRRWCASGAFLLIFPSPLPCPHSLSGCPSYPVRCCCCCVAPIIAHCDVLTVARY